jgi:hypothetical protein
MCFLTLILSSSTLISTDTSVEILMTLSLSHVSKFSPQSLQLLIYSMELKLPFLHVLKNTPRRRDMMGNHTILFRRQCTCALTRKLAKGRQT